MTTIYLLSCGYTKLGRAYTPSSAPTISIADSNNNLLVNAAATTARSVLTGVFDYSYSGADGLNLIGLWTTSDTTVDQQDLHSHPYDAVILKAIAAVDNGNGGALSLVYTVYVAGVPKEGATVKLFSDSGRTSLVNAKVSDVLGVCTFTNLVAGTYYLTVQLSGYEDLFDSEVVA